MGIFDFFKKKNDYSGEYKDGKRHGQGAFTGANGKSTSGRYEDGKKVGRQIEINY